MMCYEAPAHKESMVGTCKAYTENAKKISILIGHPSSYPTNVHPIVHQLNLNALKNFS